MSKPARQKFQNGDYLHFKHTTFTANVYWTVVVGKPDTRGQIVLINRYGEYCLVFQAEMEEVK